LGAGCLAFIALSIFFARSTHESKEQLKTNGVPSTGTLEANIPSYDMLSPTVVDERIDETNADKITARFQQGDAFDVESSADQPFGNITLEPLWKDVLKSHTSIEAFQDWLANL
jgi:hypothetical protein